MFFDPLVFARQGAKACCTQCPLTGLGSVGRDKEIVVVEHPMRRVGVESFDQRPAFQDEMRHVRFGQDRVYFKQFATDIVIPFGVVGIGLGQPVTDLDWKLIQQAGLTPDSVE
jgi:hypothetical protein